jgi:hypothetical protein
LVGTETLALVFTWTLLLLAEYPERQECAWAEILEICGHNINNFDASMLTKMKTVRGFLHIFILMHTIFYFSTYKLDVNVDTKIFPPNRCFGIQAQQICGWHNLWK